MTQEEKLTLKKDRLFKLTNNPKNIKCPGVIRKLKRQVRSLGGKVEANEA